MTKEEYIILKKYKRKSAVSRLDLGILTYLEKLKLIEVDSFYMNTINGVLFKYAITTEKGIALMKKYWYINLPLLKRFFK